LALDTALFAAALGLAGGAPEGLAPAGGLGAPGGAAPPPPLALGGGGVWGAGAPGAGAPRPGHQRRAGRSAPPLCGKCADLAGAIRRLSARHLADDRPSWLVRWLYSRHPPVLDRLALAEGFARNAEATSSDRR